MLQYSRLKVGISDIKEFIQLSIRATTVGILCNMGLIWQNKGASQPQELTISITWQILLFWKLYKQCQQSTVPFPQPKNTKTLRRQPFSLTQKHKNHPPCHREAKKRKKEAVRFCHSLNNNDNNNGHQRANLHNYLYTVNNIHTTQQTMAYNPP